MTSSPTPLSIVTLDLQALADEAHENSRAHGFWDNPPSVERSCNLMHSEVSELLEDLRAGQPVQHLEVSSEGKPAGPASELADVAIRLLDFAGGHRLRLVFGTVEAIVLKSTLGTEDEWISELHASISEIIERCRYAVDGSRRVSIEKVEVATAVASTLALVEAFANAYGIPLWAVIRQKMDYNRSRPRMHGGKAF